MLKILCLTCHDLDGPDYGASLRGRNLFRLLARHGEVRVVLAGSHKFWDDRPKPSFGGFELLRAVQFHPSPRFSIGERLRHELDPRFLNTNGFQAGAGDREWLLKTLAQHDLVWIHGLGVANGFGLWRWPASVLDIDDIPSSLYRSSLTQAASFLDQMRWRRQVFLWRRHERKITERFDALCVCSGPDREIMGGGDNIFVVPNGFTPPEKSPVRQPAEPPRIGFVGTFRHGPNRAGVRWFVEKVWPLIREKMPQARFRVAGENSEAENWRGHENVDALGWVADLESEMASWSLAVVPVFVGGGTRVKIAEAFGRQCPVVSTTLGAYGYDVTDGRDLLLADSAEGFAAKCLEILTRPATGQALAGNAWKKFNEHWTWDKQAEQMDRVVQKVLGKSA